MENLKEISIVTQNTVFDASTAKGDILNIDITSNILTLR